MLGVRWEESIPSACFYFAALRIARSDVRNILIRRSSSLER